MANQNGRAPQQTADIITRIASLEEMAVKGSPVRWDVALVVVTCVVCVTVVAALKLIPSEAAATVYGAAIGAIGINLPRKGDQ